LVKRKDEGKVVEERRREVKDEETQGSSTED
jgi:hypothetical protein